MGEESVITCGTSVLLLLKLSVFQGSVRPLKCAYNDISIMPYGKTQRFEMDKRGALSGSKKPLGPELDICVQVKTNRNGHQRRPYAG